VGGDVNSGAGSLNARKHVPSLTEAWRACLSETPLLQRSSNGQPPISPHIQATSIHPSLVSSLLTTRPFPPSTNPFLFFFFPFCFLIPTHRPLLSEKGWRETSISTWSLTPGFPSPCPPLLYAPIPLFISPARLGSGPRRRHRRRRRRRRRTGSRVPANPRLLCSPTRPISTGNRNRDQQPARP